MKNWEYISKHILVSFNEMGGKGWEMCAVHRDFVIYKRPMRCPNCEHFKRKQLVNHHTGRWLPQEVCLFDPTKEKTLYDENGCEHFKPKNNE